MLEPEASFMGLTIFSPTPCLPLHIVFQTPGPVRLLIISVELSLLFLSKAIMRSCGHPLAHSLEIHTTQEACSL